MKKETEMNFVNRQIRKYRRLSNITQVVMAQRLGMNEKTYSWLERDGNPKPDVLRKIADELGVTVDVLINGEPAVSEKSELEMQISQRAIQSDPLRFHDDHRIPAQFLQERAARKYTRKEEQVLDVLHGLPAREKDFFISFFDAYSLGEESCREEAQHFMESFIEKYTPKK